MLLEGKIAIVTGGGRGIGRAIARRFTMEGAAVMVAARTEAELRAVVSEITASGGKAAYVTADLAQEADCARIVTAARERFGPIDILVNNGGDYGPVKPIEEVATDEWDHVIAVHLRAAFLLTRAVLPEMYARGSGAILNISSLSAKSAFPWGASYAAAKAGLLGLTRTTAAEGARRGVRANAICPGPVTETRMSKDLGATLAKRLGLSEKDQLEGFLQSILQGRGQTADEVAAAAAFLASDQASSIVGQSLNVDGGAAYF